MKNRFAILITLGALLMVLMAQVACVSLGASKPPHHGAFLKKGRSFVEMEQKGLEKPSPWDEGVPHTSDKQPLVVVWDPDVIPRYLGLSRLIGGIGIRFNERSQQLAITNLIGSGSAEQAGVHIGDIIMQVNGVNVETWEQATNLMTGPVGEPVLVAVQRAGETQQLTFSMTRMSIRSEEVRYDISSKEDEVLELRPREPLSPGMYRLGAGHPLLPPGDIPHWYFVVEGSEAEAKATRQAVEAIAEAQAVIATATAEFLAPTATAEAISAQATVDAEATRQAALIMYDPPKPGLYAVSRLTCWGERTCTEHSKQVATIDMVEVLDERTMRLYLTCWSNGDSFLATACYPTIEWSTITFEDGTVLGILDSGGELANISEPVSNVKGFADFPIVRNSEMLWSFTMHVQCPLWGEAYTPVELRFKDFAPGTSMPQATEVAIAAETARVTATAEAIAAERAAVTATREAWEASVISSYLMNLIAPETNVSGPNTHMELTKIEVSSIGQMRLHLTIVVEHGSGARIMQPKDIYLWQGGQTYSAIAWGGFFEGLSELHIDGGEGTRVSGTITFPSVPDVNAPFEFHYGKYYTFMNISLNEDLIQTYLSEGQTYLNEKDFERAEKAYAKALELDPDIVQAHSALGYIYALQGKLQEALEENLKVLELAPNDYATHKNLAMIYQQLGRIEEAIAEAETALEFAPPGNKPDLEALIVQLREQIGP